MHPFLGFHVGIGGNRNGIGDHWSSLKAHGIPSCVTSVADRGAIEEFCDKSCDGSVAIFRYSHDDLGRSLSHGMEYIESADDYVQRYLSTSSLSEWSHLRHEKVWIALLNEADQERPDYLFEYSLQCAKKLNEMGIKVVVPNWASGTPFNESWATQSGLNLLAYAGENRDKCMIGIHEYSYSDNLFDAYPYKVGRMRFVVDVCKDNGLKTPRFCAKEFGYHYDRFPEPNHALLQFSQLYSGKLNSWEADCVRTIWYLGDQSLYGNVANDTQRLISPLTSWLINTTIEVIKSDMLTQGVYDKGVSVAKLHPSLVGVIPASNRPALIRAILADGRTPVSSEIRFSGDGADWVVQVGRKDYTTTGDDKYFFWREGMAEAVSTPFASSSTP